MASFDRGVPTSRPPAPGQPDLGGDAPIGLRPEEWESAAAPPTPRPGAGGRAGPSLQLARLLQPLVLDAADASGVNAWSRLELLADVVHPADPPHQEIASDEAFIANLNFRTPQLHRPTAARHVLRRAAVERGRRPQCSTSHGSAASPTPRAPSPRSRAFPAVGVSRPGPGRSSSPRPAPLRPRLPARWRPTTLRHAGGRGASHRESGRRRPRGHCPQGEELAEGAGALPLHKRDEPGGLAGAREPPVAGKSPPPAPRSSWPIKPAVAREDVGASAPWCRGCRQASGRRSQKASPCAP